MQTLGLSNSNPASDNRLKSLFLALHSDGVGRRLSGAQGYWILRPGGVCLFRQFSMRSPVTRSSGPSSLSFTFSAASAFGSKTAVTQLRSSYNVRLGYGRHGAKDARNLGSGSALSNLRATWIAANWQPDSSEASLPPRLSETWGDKFVDKLPMLLWPKVRVLYYVLSACLLALSAVGLIAIALRSRQIKYYCGITRTGTDVSFLFDVAASRRHLRCVRIRSRELLTGVERGARCC